MSSSVRLVAVLLALLMSAMAGPAVGAPAAVPLGEACAMAGLEQAARQLLDPLAEIVTVDEDGTALALAPGVYPGIRERLLEFGEGIWCPASAINQVVAGSDLDAIEVARSAAMVLPAANFDQVTVTDAVEVVPGMVELTTHARTNGVVADWRIEVDELGVRRASWTATGFGVQPFEAQIEGLTALPGSSRTYARTASGLVEPTQSIEDLAALQRDEAPSPTITVEADDGFTMHVVVGDATFYPQAANSLAGTSLPRVYGGLAPDPDTDTGNEQVDYLRIMAEGLEVNYADFLGWGMQQGWVDDEGNLYVDGALSAYCLACVLVSEYFNISMSRAAHEALEVLGYSYPDTRTALIDIVGHEMVHNFQNAYAKPDTVGIRNHVSYSEGMARHSETMHDYSAVSHQPESLVYADDINGCNGWQGANADAAFAAGPLTGQSYDACYFWMTFHAAYGVEAFVAVMEGTADIPADGRPWEIYDGALLAAAQAVDPDATLESTLANSAAMSLTGRDYRWGAPADPDSPDIDWAEFLDTWSPTNSIGADETAAATLRDGGMAAFELTSDATVDTISDQPGHAVALVIDDGLQTTTRLLADGDVIERASGETAWLVLINSGTEQGSVEAVLTAAGA